VRTTFEYQRADSPTNAVDLVAALGDDGHYVAGGTDLYLDWKNGRRLGTVVDISHLRELDYIEPGEGVIRIGALTSLRTLEHLATTDNVRASLAALARVMCTPQTRTLGTVGGNLANSSAAADLPPLLAALGATVKTVGPGGERMIAAEDVAAGAKRSTLAGAELITEVAIPVDSAVATSVHRATRTSLDIALVISAASLTLDGNGQVAGARIFLGSVGPRPIRATGAEALLVGKSLEELTAELLQQSGALAAAASTPIDDVRGSAAYRQHTTAVLTARALSDAVGQLREGKWAA